MRWSIHWLLIAVPGAIALRALGAGAPLLFFCAALAIVPLAVLIVHSTEHLATDTGPALRSLPPLPRRRRPAARGGARPGRRGRDAGGLRALSGVHAAHASRGLRRHQG